MEIFNYKKIDQLEYLNNKPFAHIEIDDCWESSLLKQCNKDVYQFDNWEGEKNFFGANKKRYSGNYSHFPNSIKKVIDELHSAKFIDWLKTFTNEKELTADINLSGGGIHSIGTGGFLKIHADPNWNTKLKLYRRLNVLIYLNEDWKDEWGGHLEFWTKNMKTCEKKIVPIFNKMAIFTTDDHSYHGHPDPLRCPSEVRRNTIAVYYYSPLKPKKGFIFKRPDSETANYKQRTSEDFIKFEERRPFETAPNGNSVIVEEQMAKINGSQINHKLTTNLYKKHLNMFRIALGKS